jgi:hypothetical protein
MERVKAMDTLQKQGFILERPEVVEAISAAIMERKANEQCN